jgi:type I restriction enzyme R subunit
MIVAEKFQTGFDQPKLHTMYVDKRLSGVHAVQTLSRLNRIYRDKEETMVLDFANEGDAIRKAFQPYYDKTEVSQATEPNVLYDYQMKIEDYGLFSDTEVDAFAKIFYNPNSKQEALHQVLRPVVDRYNSDLEDEEKIQFRVLLRDYYQLYAFMSQVVSFSDSYLEKLYEFSRLLYLKLPYTRAELPVDVREKIDLEYYRVKKTSSDDIALERGKRDLPSIGHKGSYETEEEELERLSRIIKELNDLFGTDFKDEDKVFINHLEALLMDDSALENSVRANTKENARLSFNHVFEDTLVDNHKRNFKLFKKITDDAKFKDYLLDRLFERFYRKKKQEQP